VCVAEHLPVTQRPLGIGFEKIRHPPCLKLADEEKGIADPQPHDQPVRIGIPEILCAEDKADGERRALHQGDDRQALP
jgi:hypothetical protein